MNPLILVGAILAFVVAFFFIASTKAFERRFFRIDSDNVGHVFLTLVLWMLSAYLLITNDWPETLTGGSVYTLGYLTASLIFIIVGWMSLNAARRLAEKKK